MGTNNYKTIEGNLQTVAELAVAHPGALAVFTKYNIDYCCGGHRSLDDACRRIGLDPETIKKEIAELSSDNGLHALRPQEWSSRLLIDFIVQNHHSYVKQAIPELLAFLEKVCAAHGNESIALLQIRECFEDLSEDLLSHMQKEEFVLFPAIKRLEAQAGVDHPLSATIQGPIDAMEHEHEVAGALLKQIRALSDNFTPPEFACPTFKITYKKMQEFEADLMKHIHLENNILFDRIKPKGGVGASCVL